MERLQNLEKNIQTVQSIIKNGIVNYDCIMLGSVATSSTQKILQSMEEDVKELIKMQNHSENADTKRKIIIFDSSKTSNMVNHPSHYKGNKFECIDVMLDTFSKGEVEAFCKLNAFKYLYRANKKNGMEDMKKAEWYIKKYNELTKEEK